MRLRDLSGANIGLLTIHSRAGTYMRDATWHATCACGTRVVVRSNHVLAGYVTHCGDSAKHPRRSYRSPDYVPSYNTAHRNIRKVKGRASERMCVDGCGRVADEWSYDGTDPAELVTVGGIRYSTDPDRYDARCRADHKAHDRRSRVTS